MLQEIKGCSVVWFKLSYQSKQARLPVINGDSTDDSVHLIYQACAFFYETE